MRIALLMCALTAMACGGSDNRPAEDGASATSRSGTTATAVPVNGDGSDPTSTGMAQGSSHTSSPSTAPPPGPAPVEPSPGSAVGAANSQPVNDGPGAADPTRNADNTKINERDRHGTLTPMSQGNSGDETKITAAIRRGLMSDKSLSFTAKNVKIITVGTTVTLRGPVNSDQEKATIETRAKQTAGVTDVDDQLEVKK
jgi:hyperosmotically inducible protein